MIVPRLSCLILCNVNAALFSKSIPQHLYRVLQLKTSKLSTLAAAFLSESNTIFAVGNWMSCIVSTVAYIVKNLNGFSGLIDLLNPICSEYIPPSNWIKIEAVSEDLHRIIYNVCRSTTAGYPLRNEGNESRSGVVSRNHIISSENIQDLGMTSSGQTTILRRACPPAAFSHKALTIKIYILKAGVLHKLHWPQFRQICTSAPSFQSSTFCLGHSTISEIYVVC